MLQSCMILHQGFFISLKLRKTKGLSLKDTLRKKEKKDVDLSWKTSCLSFLLLTQETGIQRPPLLSAETGHRQTYVEKWIIVLCGAELA